MSKDRLTDLRENAELKDLTGTQILEYKKLMHGDFEKNMICTSNLWALYDMQTGGRNSSYDTGIKQILAKITRFAINPRNLENINDIIGYAEGIRKILKGDK